MKPSMACLLLGACALLPFPATAQTQSATLASLRDNHRVLLVFANGDNKQAEAQLTVAAANAAGFRQRDLVLAGIAGSDNAVPTVSLSTAEDLAARKRFHVSPGQFTVLLLGKDGGEKLRSHAAFSWDTLKSTIDAMPMRREEMRSTRGR